MRIEKDEWYLEIARVVARRSTCARRQVGCVLVDEIGRIMSTGFNGVPRGMTHCTESPCAGAGLPSGTGLDLCASTHGEANALLQCPDVERVHTCYSTTEPCVHCAKLLMNTSCERVLYIEPYPGDAAALWLRTRGPGTWSRFQARVKRPP